MSSRDLLRRIWHRLPGAVRKQLLSLYYSLHEIITISKDVFSTPNLKIGDFDYNKYWGIRGKSSVQPRHLIIANVIDDGSSVLEVGCGDGWLMEFLEEQERGIRCIGFDVSETSIQMAKERGLNAHNADVMSEDFQVDSTYDYVLSCELLEHISHPEKVILKLRNSFSKAMIISAPNSAYFKYRLRLLFGRFPLQWGWHPVEHLRYWSILDFRWWISELGLNVSAVKPATGITFLNLHRLWPNMFAHDIVYIIAKDKNTAR
ncbi:MAG: methionine biosynthesis protein MetW [Nitrospirota bacterium]